MNGKGDTPRPIVDREVFYQNWDNTFDKATVKIKLSHPNARMPERATEDSAAFDLFAPEDIYVGKTPKLFECGFSMQLPEGYEAQIRPKSGLALKYGITVLNSPGTIDADYRGEVGVILYSIAEDKIFEAGDKIAQMVIKEVPKVRLEQVKELDNTERGSGGFGSTGK